MLNMTKVEFERIPDAEMYLFFEEVVRGRVSYISKRYRKASSKYFKSHDPKQESKHIIYLDANNLYGYVLSKFFSTSGLK